MVLTPPDVISQILIAIPIWLLFEAGLMFAPMFKVRKNDKNLKMINQQQTLMTGVMKHITL